MSAKGRMTWRKAPRVLVERFTTTLGSLPGAEIRRMFGYPAAFANGHMFTGLFADEWMLRLPEADRAELTALGAQPFEVMAGRPMREYLSLPASLIADSDRLMPWIERSLGMVLAMPPKVAASAAKRVARSRPGRD